VEICLKRATGIEPALKAWKAFVQPQHFARESLDIVPSQPPYNLRPVRLRALVPLLVLTGVDYALWDWSIANGHDIVSLVAGLTLLPLAALSLGGLVLAGVRLCGLLLGKSGPRARAHARRAPVSQNTTTTAAERQESSSRKLAA
jgi:hypothetical protein